MKKFLFACLASLLALTGCKSSNIGYSLRDVWVHPAKSIATSWSGPEDNSKVLEMVDFAYQNGIEHVMVQGMHLGSPEDSDAVAINKYARILGVRLIVSYDKYDRWRWGNTAALGDESRKAEADSAQILLWPCPQGETYGIFNLSNVSVGTMLGRLVTSPVEISVFGGYPESLAGNPAFGFFKDVPTEWAESKIIDIREGHHAVIARLSDFEGKWFVGGINGEEETTVKFSPDFLAPAHEYTATVFYEKDGKCLVDTIDVTKTSGITVTMPAFSGFGIEFSDRTAASAPLCVVPQPVRFEIGEGCFFKLESGAGISSGCGEFNQVIRNFLDFSAGDNIPNLICGGQGIEIIKTDGLGEEEYKMTCDADGIHIYASAGKGAWWALQSLLQIMTQSMNDGAADIRFFQISDSPAYEYRGAHLDCSRHFFTVDEVKTYIDLMAIHKLNVLHWHLTDDQGWRLEIKKYPALTEVGASRRASQIGQDYWQEDGIPYGPYFYTQEEAADIVAYAALRQVEVIPEIEMPGHAQAAIASYPWLSCADTVEFCVRPLWGSTGDGAVCPSKESTYSFFTDVLDEVCGIFPSEYIHIGGDEVNKEHWKACPVCQAEMKARGFEKEVQLHGMMIKRIEDYMLERGRRVIGWDEILEGGISQTAIVMSWRGMEGGVTAAKRGNDAVLCPSPWCYFDRVQSPGDPVYQLIPEDYRDMLTMKQAYSFDPVAGLTDMEASHIKGVQANVWTEYINDFDTVLCLFIPRISAIAEVGWTPYKTEYDWFSQRVDRSLIPLYQARGLNYYHQK